MITTRRRPASGSTQSTTRLSAASIDGEQKSALWLYAQALTDRPARLNSRSKTSWSRRLILGCLARYNLVGGPFVVVPRTHGDVLVRRGYDYDVRDVCANRSSRLEARS